MSTIRTSNFGPLTGNTASVVDPSTPTNGIARVSPLVSFQERTATGTSVDFVGIPSWARRLTFVASGVSTNGTAVVIMQVGTSAGIVTSGYNASGSYAGSGSTGAQTSTGWQVFGWGGANFIRYMYFTLSLVGSNTWVGMGMGNEDVSPTYNFFFSGKITLPGTLDRFRLTTANGTDAFDAGTVNVMYE